MQESIPYMDPMGINYASVRNVYLNFIWCKQKQTRIKGLVLIRVLSIYTKHRLSEACHQSTQSCFYTKNDSMTRFYANGNQHQQPVPQVEDKTWPVRLWNNEAAAGFLDPHVMQWYITSIWTTMFHAKQLVRSFKGSPNIPRQSFSDPVRSVNVVCNPKINYWTSLHNDSLSQQSMSVANKNTSFLLFLDTSKPCKLCH